MADLLRSGNTMLNMACPVCNNPIFRKKNGEAFCPTCNRKVLILKDKNEYSYKTNEENIVNGNKQEDKIRIQNQATLNLLKNALYEKIEWITHRLMSETQIHVIESYSNVLSNFIRILNNFPQ